MFSRCYNILVFLYNLITVLIPTDFALKSQHCFVFMHDAIWIFDLFSWRLGNIFNLLILLFLPNCIFILFDYSAIELLKEVRGSLARTGPLLWLQGQWGACWCWCSCRLSFYCCTGAEGRRKPLVSKMNSLIR